MFKNYVKIAWRNLAKNKVSAIINILGLTLGISVCMVIYLVTSFELSYDTFHADKERIYRVVSTTQKQDGDKQYAARVPGPVAEVIKKEFTGVEVVTEFLNFYTNVTIPNGNGEPKQFAVATFDGGPTDVIVTDTGYFSIIKYQWLAGNVAAFQQPAHVVLAASKAQQYFGNIPFESMIGKEVVYSGSLRLTVAGIVKDYSKNSDFIFKDFICFNSVEHSFLKDAFALNNWNNWSPLSQTFVKLAKGTTTKQFNTQMARVVNKEMNAGPGVKLTVALQPLTDIHFNAAYSDAYGRRVNMPTLYGLISIAIFILVIAAINFINLSIAQSFRRAKEIGIRKVMGGKKSWMTLQFLTETFIITLFSVIISVAIAPLLLAACHSFIPNGVSLHYNADTVYFILIVIIVTSLLAGLYPARVLSSYLPVIILKGGNMQTGNTKNYLQKSLIVLQFTISLALIIGSLVIGRQTNYVLNADMGFAKDAIITIPTGFRKPAGKKQIFANSLRALPGIKQVSVAIGTPVEKRHAQTWIKCSEMGDGQVSSEYQTCDENYLSLYQIKLVAGRNLLPSDTMKEFLINETCAKKLGFKQPEDAIGKIAEIGTTDASGPKRAPIVGVVADFHSQSLHEVIQPTFITQSASFSKVVTVKLATQDKQVSSFKQTLAGIEKIWKGVYADAPFEYAFFDETVAQFYDKEQKTEQIINAAMIIAIAISCMGLFALASFTAQQRSKEIGIRKVLGAGVASIVALLSKDFLKPVIIAIAIASPVAYYFVHSWLQGFAYRIHISGWLFVLAGVAAVAITLATISFQTIKAAMANPVGALKNE